MEAIWDELSEDMLNPLVQKALDNGRVPIGYTCHFAPMPLLSVGKLFPLAMRAPGASTTELADVYLSSVICAYTRSLQEFHMQGSYYFMGGWVIPCACDHIRRLNDHLDMLKTPEDTYFNYCLDVPRKDGDLWVDYYAKELRNLASKLEAHFGVKIDEKSLKEEIVKITLAVSIVCLVFLFHLPSALVVILTLPLAIILSFILMYYLGITSNVMSLSGIAIAIGTMVDAAIIIIKNAHKRLKD